ncbi:sulfite exporter TauE/SafE family protein [Pseudoroseicyclus sp. CLL3-39]|uniref:Probable membrane transporter protein n=1 Tax=Pseudoroseicyclus tamaricis TaxID=2705421 RepID=A0A6B2JPV2_9RHOB|nr:sulfite exporter TauE/SafE family protein [Pseudoroseicyclus tamaricis]
MPLALIACALVGLAAILRGLTGFGFALAAVPMLSLVLPPEEAVVICVLLQALIGLRDIVTLRRQIDRRQILWLSLGALAGTPLGILTLRWLDADVMRLVLGLIVFAAVPALLRPPRPSPDAALGLALPVGAASGFFGGLAAMPGPPAIAYFIRAATPPARMRASLMIFFFVTSAIALPGFALSGLVTRSAVLHALLALPVMLAGTWLGGEIFRRTAETHYKGIALAILLATALLSAVRGLAALAGWS